MKTSLISFVALAACFSAPARAEPGNEPPSFEVKRKSSSAEFVIQFQSRSGDVTEDDMTATLKQGDKEIPLPLQAGWYLRTGAIRDQKKLPSICAETPAARR